VLSSIRVDGQLVEPHDEVGVGKLKPSDLAVYLPALGRGEEFGSQERPVAGNLRPQPGQRVDAACGSPTTMRFFLSKN
jgi:hypothetical protein